MPEQLSFAYSMALRELDAELDDDALMDGLPVVSPYTWEDVLGRDGDWVPKPRYVEAQA